jgi:hypothetical protein
VTDLSLDRSARRVRLATHFGPEGTVRPSGLLTALFGLSPEAAHGVRIVKTATLPADFSGPADREMLSGT